MKAFFDRKQEDCAAKPQRGFQGRISVIIPTLNEATNLPTCLPARFKDVEVIVADGGSRDGTIDVAIAKGWRVCPSALGRAKQMNAGAGMASGDIFLFLHADTRLPEDFALHVRRILSKPDIIAGAFRLRIDAPMRKLRIMERLANWRSACLQMPYGDQAIFLRAEQFRAVGGFPDLPIMEDFEFVRRLRKRGRIATAPVPVITSSRRWEEKGVWRTTLINQICIVGYCLGVAPSRIHRWYDGNRGPSLREKACFGRYAWGPKNGK